MKKKPNFERADSHKMIKLGKGVKKNKKWRAPKGIQNKVRLNRKGYQKKVKIGWGNDKKMKNKIGGEEFVRVENLADLNVAGKKAVVVGSVGKKKREQILSKAKEMKIKILNKYKSEEKNATS